MKKINFLRFIVGASITAVIILSCFGIFFISPAYTDLIINSAELEAVKVGRHLAGPLLRENRMVDRQLPSDFIQMAGKAVSDFGLEKVKVFSPVGEIVYSSDPDDIGVFNERAYFRDIVTKGGVYTKFVEKNTRSLEGRLVRADVVETYVPIMHGDIFAGAFELYFDITDIKRKLDGLLIKTYSLQLLIGIGLIMAVLAASFIARKFIMKQESAEKEIIEQGIVLGEMNDELLAANKEMSLLFNFVPAIICTAGTDGYFKNVNPAMEKILGFSKPELLSRPLLDFVHPDDRHPPKKESHMKIDGRSIRYFQNRYRCKDGTYRLLEWTTTSAVDGILYASAKDITEQKQAEAEREKLIGELQKALSEIKTLQGLIPICMYCKKIKSDKGVWDQLEVYLEEHSEADFSHGCCPECYEIQLKKIHEGQ